MKRKNNFSIFFVLSVVVLVCISIYVNMILIESSRYLGVVFFTALVVGIGVVFFRAWSEINFAKEIAETSNIFDKEKYAPNISDIDQLSKLISLLFNSFNNLIKEDGLLERIWNSIPVRSREDDEKFQKKIEEVRRVVKEKDMMHLSSSFKTSSDLIIFASHGISADEMDYFLTKNKEKGMLLVVRLIGTSFAQMEFEKLESMLDLSYLKYCWISEEELERDFRVNQVNIFPFKLQFQDIRRLLMSRDDMVEQPGILKNILELARFINHRLLVEQEKKT